MNLDIWDEVYDANCIENNNSKIRKIPFPQANDINKVYEILIAIDNYGVTSQEIANRYKFRKRQGDYYLNSLYFFDFVEKHNSRFFINKNGMRVINSDAKNKKREFSIIILKNIVFKEAYILMSNSHELSTKYIINFISKMIQYNYLLKVSTSHRRASTVINWINWILKNNPTSLF